MGTAVANTSNNAIAANSNPWLEEGNKESDFFGVYAKFSGKTGDYTYGSDDDEIELGTTVIVDFNLIEKGFVCWKDDEVADRQFVKVASGQSVDKRSLEDHGPYDEDENEGWQETYSMPFVIDSEAETEADDSQAYVIQLSSGGGKKAMRRLMKAYGSTFMNQMDENGDYKLPVIEFDNESYKSKIKKVGTVYNPVFTIVDWVSRDEIADRIALLGGTDSLESAGDDEDEDDTPEDDTQEDDTEVKEEKEEKTARKPRRGRAQKAENDEDTGGIEPEDAGEPEEKEEEDPAPRRRRRTTKAKDEEKTEEKATGGTRRAGGRRARKFD